MTPAIASDPYWAAAPSRRTSTRCSAIDGIVDRSGPCAPFGGLGHQPGDDRSAVAALPVHKHERVVRRQIADVGRPHDGRSVRDGLRVDVEGRNDRPQQVEEIGPTLCPHAGPADHVHRRVGLDRGPAAAPRANDDDLVQFHHRGDRVGAGERVGRLLGLQHRGHDRKGGREQQHGGGADRDPAHQKETVTVIETVRDAPSQAAFSVIVDR
ncbi:MAG: hypothetical protein OXK77_02925 [Gemmatimonadota bacterium]|nr:hypothetical protein [Gemmatimonadota bacterium]MDE2864119.1 hypothetical protein [Gemmatimonadota bacterium]